MKQHGHIITAMLCTGLLLSVSTSLMAVHRNTRSVENGINRGTITLKLKATGRCYSGPCMNMLVTNLSSDSVYYKIEAGRRLKADNSSAQDILITQDQQIALAPRQKINYRLFGFCCQLSHHAPMPNAGYGIGAIAAPDLAAIASFLNRHNTYDISTQQNAVWCVSDNISLASVMSYNRENIKPLLDTLAAIKHVTVPWYSLSYEKDKNMLFSGRPETFNCDLRYYLANNAIVDISIYDSTGTKLMTYSESPGNPDTYVIPISLNVKGWAHGPYSICVSTDGNMILRKKFEL
jgi:hypothetical protein